MSMKTISVDEVSRELKAVALADPEHVDPTADEEHLVPQYVHHGRPNCLVARVLVRLGYSTDLLRDLDRERPVGELLHSGVRVSESRHPGLRRIDPVALKLLQYCQDQQDRGQRWGAIVADAFTLSRWFAWRDRARKPWLDRRAA
jgi:hypothetical protein